MSQSQRSRTYTWDDTRIGLSQLRELSGLEFLEKMIAGQIPPPPIAQTMDFKLVEVEKGRAVFEGQAGEYLYNPIGSIHGGVAATLLDSALGCAVQTMLDAGVGYTTLQLNVHYTRAMTADTGLFRCEARVLHSGRTTATAEAELRDSDGKLYAHGTTACMIFTP